jgi:hypothetical protein
LIRLTLAARFAPDAAPRGGLGILVIGTVCLLPVLNRTWPLTVSRSTLAAAPELHPGAAFEG